MAGISSDVLGEIILNTVFTFPDFFTGNYTLGQVLSAVRSNDTFLQIIVNSTGLDKQSVTNTVDTYLAIVEYLNPTAAPTTSPTQNISENNTVCKDYVNPGVFTSFSLLPSLLIILILSCLSQRKRSFSCFGRTVIRPGLCIPVNLVDSYENRFAFACAFGATTTKCLSILFYGGNDEIYSPETIRVIEDPSNPSWLGIVWKILAMIVIGLAYYPLFACMSTDYKITGFVIGFLYSLLWVIMNVAQFITCPSLTSVVFPYDYFFLELPVTLCLVYLTLRYFVLMVKAIHRRCTRRRCIMTEEEEDWRTSYKYRYVVKLLKPIPKELRGDEAGLREKVKEKLYKWKPEFKYSTRVVCTYFISFIGIYEILVVFVIVGGFILRIMQGIDEMEVQGVLGISGVKEILLVASVSVFVAVGITGFCSIILVANMLSWYRGHLLRLQRGEKDFLPVQLFTKNPSSITVATLKYCGFQVAYMIWAATILIVTLGVIGFVVGQQLILPMVHGRFDSFLWNRAKNLWPAIIISLGFFAVQLLLSKFVFMMDRGKTLALNNRRLFHVCTFFLFFFNIFLGVVSCLRRIIIGAVLGVLFLGRLQKSVIPRDYELMDPGYNAYVGYLILEHTHANPVLVTFCQLLINSVTNRQELEVGSGEENYGIENHEQPSGEKGIKLRSIRQRKFTRIRNRWQLLLTLHNNPTIQEDRHSELFQVKSAFAAIQVMIGKTVVQQLDQGEGRKDEERRDEDSKL